MSEQSHLTNAERITLLFQSLGIHRAHVVAAGGLEAGDLAVTAPHRIASMTYVCPSRFTAEPQISLASSLLLIHGDRGPASSLIPAALPTLPGARHVILQGFEDALWSDPVADRLSEIGPAMLEFLANASDDSVEPVELAKDHGEIAGITFRVQGSGPPLVLFPLNLAAAQWDPLLPLLARHYCTITLGGASLWPVSQLEQRAQSGYGTVVKELVETCAPRPGERVLDVGCGSGAISRWLAKNTGGANPTVGVDVNRYLLRAAADLAVAEEVAGSTQFQEADAETLPFPADSFDVTLGLTVLEEGNADRMLSEIVRVTRPGGRVGVVVRAEDIPLWDNLALPPEIRAKLAGSVSFGADERGCADASLYRRVCALGLTELTIGPQFGIYRAASHLDSVVSNFEFSQLALLSPQEAQTWRAAADQAEAAGTYLWASPFHCAVGTIC